MYTTSSFPSFVTKRSLFLFAPVPQKKAEGGPFPDGCVKYGEVRRAIIFRNGSDVPFPQKERKTYMKKNSSIRLTESAIMIAFAAVLSLVKIVDMPYGGSVTAASMLPVILIAYRYGTAWGLFTGFTASLLMLVLGMSSLSYATSGAAAFAIIMLDYIVAFTVMGLGGIFRNRVKKQSTALALGTLVVGALRYICHVISGCTVWAGVSIPDTDGLLYSLGYNAVYMVPETIITVAAAVALGSALDFRKEGLAPLRGDAGMAKRSFGAFFLLIAAAIDALFLFSSTQVENADGDVVFSVTGLAQANWLLIGMITAGALLAYFAVERLRPAILLGTGVVYAAASLIVSAVTGGEADILLIAGVLAVCVVLTMVVGRLYASAAAVTGILVAGLYLASVLLGGEGLAVYDYIILVVALLGGVVASAAIGKYLKNRKQTD